MNTQVEIFGTHYTFDGDDPERIRELAEYVNQKMVETARDIRNVTTSKVAVLAAMNLAEELLTLHQSIDRSNRAAAERIDKLVGLSKSLASSPADETEPDQHES